MWTQIDTEIRHRSAQNPCPSARRGITFLELMVVVVILGILGAVAISNYRRTVERGYCRVAQDMLLTIHAGERAYYFTHDQRYYGPLGKSSLSKSAPGVKGWDQIFMDNPHLTSIPVTFTVTAPGATFTATATRDPGGDCGDRKLTIDQDRRFIVKTWADNNPNCCGALSQ